MITSGRLSARADLSRGKSRTSARIERTARPTSACSNKFGCVGASRAYPLTLAPRVSSHSDSQLPLKPVWPVTKTLRPFQNERLGTNASHRRSLRGLNQRISCSERPACILLLPEGLDQPVTRRLFHIIQR